MVALTTALTLPDICGNAEFPNEKNWKRYISWYDNEITSNKRNGGGTTVKDMLDKAKGRLNYYDNISFVQGDVGKLPFEDASFNTVLSMNGFHAFPDKKKAFLETNRVLKKGGSFIGCFYIKGKSKRTDWLVRRILTKKGWFTPPFLTEESLHNVLHKLYSEVECHIDGSMAFFKCKN